MFRPGSEQTDHEADLIGVTEGSGTTEMGPNPRYVFQPIDSLTPLECCMLYTDTGALKAPITSHTVSPQNFERVVPTASLSDPPPDAPAPPA
mgnify:CR=1 FL=1|jgi:hypothetical protein